MKRVGMFFAILLCGLMLTSQATGKPLERHEVTPSHAAADIVGDVVSFIWIANTGDGTISKIDTRLEVEVARYITSPLGAVAEGDPSRTSVNRHGDAIVLNRRHPDHFPNTESASVTKYAASKHKIR